MVFYNRTVVSEKSGIVLKIDCLCDGHKHGIQKALKKIGCSGDEYTIQSSEGTITMSTSCSREPDDLIWALARYAKIKAKLFPSSTQQPPLFVWEDNSFDRHLEIANRSVRTMMEPTNHSHTIQVQDQKLKKNFPKDYNLRITHPGHHHTLVFQHAPVPYDCHGCKEKGFKSCFKCNNENCNFYLHNECAEPKPHAHHKFFKDCDLIFHEEAPGWTGGGQNRYCGACGMVLRGFRYQCLHEITHDFHPTCLKLPWVIENDEIKLELQDKVSSDCLLCGKKEILKGIKGWTYASTSSSGDQYCYHISCVKEIIYENWKKDFLSSRGEPSYVGSSSLSLVPSIDDTRIVKHGKDSTKRSKASMLGKIAKVVLRFIISVLTGDVSGLILAAIGI